MGIDLIFTLFEDNLSPASLHAQPPLCKVPSLGKVEHSDVSGCFLCYLLQWPSKGEAGRNKNADCEKCPKHFRLKSFVSKVLPQNLCQKFSQLTVSVGMSIEGPAVAFYPGAF